MCSCTSAFLMPQNIEPMNIQKIRKDTPGLQSLIHFNNAGCSLPVQSQLDIICNYLQEEAITGGYRLQAQHQEVINQFYQRAAQLINAKADEIAITGNASEAFNHILYSIPFEKGDVIITSEVEYSNNFINYINLKNSKGIEIVMLRNLANGDFDLAALEHAISDRVKLLAITHIPTSSGVVVPVEAIGAIAKKHNILYLVDACQSIGQIPFDVEKVGCDFASATARKYLRGPRGLGFLYVKKSVIPSLKPKSLDNVTAHWKIDQRVELEQKAIMFEHWEKSYALVEGFSEALRYLLDLGVAHTWARIQELSTYARQELGQVSGVRVLDQGTHKCGIVTFNKKGLDPLDIQKALQKQSINTSATLPFSSLTDLHYRGLDGGALRASIHYFNTKEEIEVLLKEIDRL